MIIGALIPDREAFMASGYTAAAAELLPAYGADYMIRAPGAEVLEGDWGNGASVVVTRWPDKETALRFWHSPEYTAARKLREGLSDMQILLIETAS